MNKKVSIIVPVYKSEPFLDKLINSVLNQTYKNFELILVDDGSPDNSGLLCDSYAENDSRIKVIHQKNSGCSSARNTGLNAVTGEYITFIDGDDWIEPDCIEYLVNLLENNDADMSMTDAVLTTSNMTPNHIDNIRVWSNERALCGIFYVEIPIGAWSKLYKTELIKNNKIVFANFWFGEGLYFSALAAQHSSKIAVGHKKVYGYRKNNPNSGTTLREVKNGIGALEHSIFISDSLSVKTKKVMCATNWHNYMNYFNLLMYIIGADSKKEYYLEYKKCKKYIRKNGFSVLFKSKIRFKYKLYLCSIFAFPVLTAKHMIKRKNNAFKKDLLK